MNRELLNKLRTVAASAESLADDYEFQRLWSGDLKRKISEISRDLGTAVMLALKEDKSNV